MDQSGVVFGGPQWVLQVVGRSKRARSYDFRYGCAMASDINSILKKYLAALGRNEENVADLAKNLRTWVATNGEVVKEKIENQIDENAVRMGFVKVDDLDRLMKRLADLESRVSKTEPRKARNIKSPTTPKKKTVAKSSATVKKSAPKKGANK